MGVHNLVTGLNGHGKTLYVVATKLRPLEGSTVEYKGRQVPRRLLNGGIRELLIEHELLDVPTIDPELFVDEWSTVQRQLGGPPVRFVRKTVVNAKSQALGYVACGPDEPDAEPILTSALNWWAWVEPGDVIVIDECQRLFRPMASGRRVPRFIAELETARHYGAEFIYITQHPQLLHVNVRNLVGPHEDVRRIFGTARCMVYQWDKVSNPDRINKATGKMWKHDPTAYRLYRSSELHNKFSMRLPMAAFVLIPALLGALYFFWWLLWGRGHHAPAAAPAPSSAVAPASPESAVQNVASGPPAARTGSAWPAIDPEPVKLTREPYAGRGFQIEGGYVVDGKPFGIFGLVQDGQRIATVTLAELVRAGYAYTNLGPCSGLLRFGERERVLSCGPRGQAADRPAPPAPASSGVTA